MNDVLSNNYIESVKGAQKTIFLASTTSVILYSLALTDDFSKIKVPIIGLEFEGVTGLSMLFLVFISLGIYLIFQLNQIISNFELIKCSDLKMALRHYPSVVCGNKFSRVFFICLPSLFLTLAMYEAYKGSIVLTIFITALMSIPYILSLAVENPFNESLDS